MAAKTFLMETPVMDSETPSLEWGTVYRIGATAALLVVLAGLLDIFMMFLPGTNNSPGTRTVVDWFVLFEEHWFLALRDLGLLNMLTISCSVVVFFALFGLHRRKYSLPASLALIVVSIGAAVYIASNIALPMLTLSQHYAAANTESQKLLWAAAGQTLLAQEDLTAGAFPGFLIVEVAGLIMTTVALRGGIFRRGEGWVGLVATACLLFFNICAAFIPVLYDTVMPIFGAGGGLLSIVWYALIARRLFLQPPAVIAAATATAVVKPSGTTETASTSSKQSGGQIA